MSDGVYNVMKKWLFSKNGKVVGPFVVNEANDFVVENPDSYAWHPSYSHWMPVTCISEFENSIPAPKPPSVIPKELIEEFIGEERKLVSRLAQLDEHLLQTDQSLLELDNEIKTFQDITQNCTAEVRATLQSIEQQFANLSKNLSNFKSATTKGKEELTDISENFNTRLDNDTQTQLKPPKKENSLKINSQALPQEFAEALVEKITNTDNSIKESKAVNTINSPVNSANQVSDKAPTTKNKKIISTAASTPFNQVSMSQAEAEESDVAIVEIDCDEQVTVAEEVVNPKKQTVVEDIKPAVNKKENVANEEKTAEKIAQRSPEKSIKIEKIEFSDQPTKEDILLASQLKQIDKPISYEAPELVKPDIAPVGEFDHILYDSIGSEEQVVDEDKSKKRLRRRRRR